LRTDQDGLEQPIVNERIELSHGKLGPRRPTGGDAIDQRGDRRIAPDHIGGDADELARARPRRRHSADEQVIPVGQVGRIAQRDQDAREQRPGLGRIAGRERTMCQLDGFQPIALRKPQKGEILQRFGQLRGQCKRSAERRGRLLRPAELTLRLAEVAVYQRGSRLDFQRARERLDGILELALRRQSAAAIVVCLRKARIERNRAVEVFDGLVVAPESSQRFAHAVVAIGYMIVHGDRRAEKIDRAFVAPALMLDDAEEVQAADVVRIGGENLAVDLFGLRQAAALVMVERCREKVGLRRAHLAAFFTLRCG
jgi:hypothetical protein